MAYLVYICLFQTLLRSNKLAYSANFIEINAHSEHFIVVLRLVEAFTLTVISIDRLLAVTYPLQPPIKRRTAIVFSLAIWVCAGGTSVPLIISRDYLVGRSSLLVYNVLLLL